RSGRVVSDVVIHGRVARTATFDQRQQGDQWNTIGKVPLPAGTQVSVRIKSKGQGSFVADAIHLRSVARYNNGSPASSICLAPLDGIILARSSHSLESLIPAEPPPEDALELMSFSPGMDSDGDGFADLDERIAGTDAFDAEKVFELRYDEIQPGAFSVTTSTQSLYCLQYTSDPAACNWLDMAIFPGNGQRMLITNRLPSLPQACFRLTAQPAP
ncbi:MAG: hypothetical protein V2A34_07960, partial [Lentisphaerota bacterium]